MSTKNKLIQATIDLALVQGLGAVSLGEVAEAVGIKKPSIYNHFKSKADLIDEVFAYLETSALTVTDWLPSVSSSDIQSPLSYLEIFGSHFEVLRSNEDHLRRWKVLYGERYLSKEAERLLYLEQDSFLEAVDQHLQRLEAFSCQSEDDRRYWAMCMAHGLMQLRSTAERKAFLARFEKQLTSVGLPESNQAPAATAPVKAPQAIALDMQDAPKGGLLWRNKKEEYL